MEINDIVNDEIASIIKKTSKSSSEYEKLYYHIIPIKEKKEPDIHEKVNQISTRVNCIRTILRE